MCGLDFSPDMDASSFPHPAGQAHTNVDDDDGGAIIEKKTDGKIALTFSLNVPQAVTSSFSLKHTSVYLLPCYL